MEEYKDLIEEMTLEVERVDQENEILCDDIEAMQQKYDENEVIMESLREENEGWNKKFLAVLGELEKTKRTCEEVEEKNNDLKKEVVKAKERRLDIEDNEEVMKDFELLLKENESLKKQIEYVKVEKEEVEQPVIAEKIVDQPMEPAPVVKTPPPEKIEKPAS